MKGRAGRSPPELFEAERDNVSRTFAQMQFHRKCCRCPAGSPPPRHAGSASESGSGVFFTVPHSRRERAKQLLNRKDAGFSPKGAAGMTSRDCPATYVKFKHFEATSFGQPHSPAPPPKRGNRARMPVSTICTVTFCFPCKPLFPRNISLLPG